MPVAGTYSTVNGTSYEAENGTLGGAAVLFSDPSFSGGGAVGYLGGSCYCSLRKTMMNVSLIRERWDCDAQ